MRKKPSFVIVSKSNWQGDFWRIDETGIASRKQAEARVNELENAQPGVFRNDRRYRVLSMTQVKREFGADWYNNI